MPKITKEKIPDDKLVSIFWFAHEEAFFNQVTIALITCRSIKTLEMERWKKKGIPFRKIGGKVLYKKNDVINWLEGHKLIKGNKNDT